MDDIEYIEYIDHCAVKDWYPRKRVIKEMQIVTHETAGWIIKETHDHLVLASSRCQHDDTCSNSTMIMKALIVRREKLSRARKR